MSYAIRNDGQGWRAINSPADVLSGEWVSNDPPAIVIADSGALSVTALQGLLALDQYGMASLYETWANNPARTFAQKAFINKALTWKRDDPTLNAAALDLGLTSTQLDNLFALAATL